MCSSGDSTALEVARAPFRLHSLPTPKERPCRERRFDLGKETPEADQAPCHAKRYLTRGMSEQDAIVQAPGRRVFSCAWDRDTGRGATLLYGDGFYDSRGGFGDQDH